MRGVITKTHRWFHSNVIVPTEIEDVEVIEAGEGEGDRWSQWTELGPGVPLMSGMRDGHVVFTRRWCKRMPRGDWAVVIGDWWVQRQDEWECVNVSFYSMRCVNPLEPVDTRTWSNSRHDHVPGAEVTAEGARRACAEHVFSADWDGEVHG